MYVLYYIIYIINAVGARFIVFVPDFIAAAPIFTPSPQGLSRLVGAAAGADGGDNQLTAIPIAVGQGSGMGVMTPSLLVARGMVVELRGMVVVLRGLVAAASGLMPEGVVKLISRCEIVIANRDIMISHRETVISNPEINIKAISVRMMAVGVALSVCVVIRVCFHVH
uniref:hypothetical protein n=1 Tax=Prevotella sp. TaxID=59823 RepID=UPI0040297F66